MSEKYSDEYYTNKVFLNAVLPVMKTLSEEALPLLRVWAKHSGICQIRCEVKDEAGFFRDGIHFIITDGKWDVMRGLYDGSPDVELAFKSRKHLNGFFKGKYLPLPSFKGIFNGKGLFLPFMKSLLFMSSLLGSKKPPKKKDDQRMLVKCMFYLLSSGISTLNKLKHPKVYPWTQMSPDRVYAWAVTGEEELSAYIRIKAGKSKASRGQYKRSMPFFTMKFNSVLSAIGILLSIDDMLESTIDGKLIMEGGPEYGSMLGEQMLLVGSLIQ